MPKAAKLRKYRVSKQAEPYEVPKEVEQTNTEGDKVVTSLSKGQKKRQLKREKVMMKMGIIPVKGLKTAPETTKKKSFHFLLSELEASLPTESDEVVRPAAAAPIKTNKMKKSVAVREVERMKLVQQHPSFKDDPIVAMKAHIEHMIALKKKSR
jgi:hypothetical protein